MSKVTEYEGFVILEEISAWETTYDIYQHGIKLPVTCYVIGAATRYIDSII